MRLVSRASALLLAVAVSTVLGGSVPIKAQGNTQQAASSGRAVVRLMGVVRDEKNAITLPGVPVEVVTTKQVVYTDIDGKYFVDVRPGEHELKISMDGYTDRIIKVTVPGADRTMTIDVAMSMASLTENITVTATAVDAPTSSAEAQLIERKAAPVITDNMGAQEMRRNGDSDAAAAMTRVTGLSVVDNQYVFVRGLGERYSNTTLAGSVLPTTEPDKKVVPLDLFPSGLIDSIQVAKSYSPDKSSEFAGGLVQINPLKFPNRPMVDMSIGFNHYSTATGKSIPLSPLGSRDWLGYDNGARALPGVFPDEKIVRQGIFTPDVGFSNDQIANFGKALTDGGWRPQLSKGTPGKNWSMSMGNHWGKVGVVASATQSYKEQGVTEQRKFFRVAGGSGDDVELEATSDYAMQFGTQKAQLGIVGNVTYQATPSHRIFVDNFYTHSGRDEGRVFEGFNLDNNRVYRDYRTQFIEEGLNSNSVGGDHFFRSLSNSRLDWRFTSARANRDEPRLREVYYEYVPPTAANAPTPPFTLADESQSGLQMFNALDDDSLDFSANWSTFQTRGRPIQYKFGVSYVDRDRSFVSRRFRYIPITLTKDGALQFNNQQTPEELYTSENIGRAFRFNEETRPTDAYEGAQSTAAVYAMIDAGLGDKTRLVTGARVESFDQQVDTFDPFGLFERTLTAENKNTDVFPAVNLVRSLTQNSNLRLSYSTTVNRPEFRELAEFEFTDIVGNRAVRGNPQLQRALIQNVDGRWEMFTGGRGVLAASVFYKYFDQPIETVVLGAAQPISTYQNADRARNVGIEFEASRQFGQMFYATFNYTFVDSSVTLRPEQVTVQTSSERALVGQSENVVNLGLEATMKGFTTRVLYNYFGDRIAEAGSNEAPDVFEQGRNTFDLVLSQRLRDLTLRLSLENLNNASYRFTQGGLDQRLFKLGRTVTFSVGYSLF
jgi:TonB-dependent receptor